MSNNVFGVLSVKKEYVINGAMSSEEQEAFDKKNQLIKEECIEYLKSLPHEQLLDYLIASPCWQEDDSLTISLTITCQSRELEKEKK